MKDGEGLRVCQRLEETSETQQRNAMWGPRQELGTEKGHSRKNRQILVRSAVQLISWQC